MIGPVWIAGGTTEGRKLAGYAARFQIKAYVSVATTYGASLLPVSPYITVLEGRMDRGEMEEFLREKGITLAIDATHPYATAVTDNIKGACQKAGVPYRRINRRAGTYRTDGRTIAVRTVDEAVEVLSHTVGPVFLACRALFRNNTMRPCSRKRKPGTSSPKIQAIPAVFRKN